MLPKLELDCTVHCLSVSVPMARGDTSLAHDQKHSLWRAISKRCGMSEVGLREEQEEQEEEGNNLKMCGPLSTRQHQLILGCFNP